MAGKDAVDERELGGKPMTTEELDLLIGQHDYKLFLNSRNELYRARRWLASADARRSGS
jgi:hypothetical protein